MEKMTNLNGLSFFISFDKKMNDLENSCLDKIINAAKNIKEQSKNTNTNNQQ